MLDDRALDWRSILRYHNQNNVVPETLRLVIVELLQAPGFIRGVYDQLYSSMQTGSRYGMQTMDSYLQELCQKELIPPKDATEYGFGDS